MHFTMLMRPLVRWWRRKGLRIVAYSDDGICAVETEQQALKDRDLVQDSLCREGSAANEAKSCVACTEGAVAGL